VSLIAAGTLVTGDEVFSPGWLRIVGGRFAEIGGGEPPGPLAPDLTVGVVVPGFVDMHVHGGGGYSYTSTAPLEIAEALTFHRRLGTTTTLASLVTAAEPDLIRSIRALAEFVQDGELAGIHLEGPWLSPGRAGAHDRAQLRDPDRAELDRLLAAGGGAVRMVTVAPELPGALGLISAIAEAGVVAAIGHTDADFATTARAINAGATVGTHLFNAMRPVHHREPGPVVALLDDPRVTVEMIPDGVHQHPAMLATVARAAGPDRVAVVSDAIAASGMNDGDYRLGSLGVVVHHGVARVRETGAIAGSTATMAQLFRAVAAGAVGVPVPDRGGHPDLVTAARLTAVNPSRALGLTDVGRIAPGYRADIAVLSRDLRVRRVLRRGAWV
jgi:N-acetylglucosamine-6-phosphate deacetylase